MKELELKEVQKIELEMLKCISNFCIENDIMIYLSGGTLLGAIRHKGFIPWDDDIDIHASRDNYEKFLRLYPKEGINGNILYKPTDYNNPQVAFSFIKNINTFKLQKETNKDKFNEGIAVDFFPIDGIPNDPNKLRLYYLKQNILNKILIGLTSEFCFQGNLVIKCIKFLFTIFLKILKFLHIITPITIVNMINNLAICNKISDCDRVACSVFLHYGQNEIIDKQKFLVPVNVTFENNEFFAQSNYNEYLTNLYGENYMDLPPLEKRKSHHIVKFYLK